MGITQFAMEEVRCFGDRQTLEIRPLTFLVGENSTGKTTALACFHILANFFNVQELDFNFHPYSMGTFKDIVRNSKNRDKRFNLGFTYKLASEEIEVSVEFKEKPRGIEPIVNSITLFFSDGKILFKFEEKKDRHFKFTTLNEEMNHYQVSASMEEINNYPLYFIFLTILRELESVKDESLSNFFKKKFNRRKIQPSVLPSNLNIFSTSPIRSRPKRTYDPTREFNDPEGSDVPMYLMRIEATEVEKWKLLKHELIEFGKDSGLFQNIQIKKLGRSLGSPFQLQFKVRGPSSNIIDVGYGISQLLPILVQALNFGIFHEKSSMIPSDYTLLQQPEVHLHPRAQAEFSSLLAKLTKQGKQSFIIETHSDYMIDRTRIDIRKGNIKPEDVSLIYFEPKRNIVKVHNISFDKFGNPIDVPNHYREFFIKETDRLLGFDD